MGAATQTNEELPTPAKTCTACTHCATPLGRAAPAPAFCCSGCKLIYHSLQGLGLTQFYALRAPGEVGRAADDLVAERSFSHFDSVEFQNKYISEKEGGESRVILYLPGIHCAACVWLLEKLPQLLPGVTQSIVHFGHSELSLSYRTAEVRLSAIASLLNSLGYTPVPASDLASREEERRQDRRALLRIGVAAFCMLNTMMIACSLFEGFFTGIEEPFASIFRWVSALLATPAVFYSAYPFYQSALRSLLLGSLHIDLPISIALLGAYLAGVYNTLEGREYVYFDSITALIFLLLVARWIQQKAVRRARGSTRTSWDFLPSRALLVSDQGCVSCALNELPNNALIEVPAGEIVAADGVVERGHSSIDAALLTGESLPQPVSEGSTVYAGTVNLESTLRVRVHTAGTSTRVAKILAEVESAQFVKSPLENAANRLSAYFVAAVLLLSLFTFIGWYWIDPSQAFDHAVAVLILTCPCALGLAIPAAVSVAIGAASRAGILIKRTDSLERLAECEHFYFDKTGTLTEGELVVAEQVLDDETVASAAAYLAGQSPQHPAARAIVKACVALVPEQHLPLRSRLFGGRGVLAEYPDGSVAMLGSRKWCREQRVRFTSDQESLLDSWEEQGISPLVYAAQGSARGLFGLRDQLSPQAPLVFDSLHTQGAKTFLLSGDATNVVRALATRLSTPEAQVYGSCYPDQKAAVLAADPQRKAMIGDGVNDALAMKQADVGIALRGGIEGALEAADIFIVRGGLGGVKNVVRAARTLRRVIRRNLAFSVAYNGIGGILAMLGLVDPFIAALIMPISSLTVIGSSVAARYFEK